MKKVLFLFIVFIIPTGTVYGMSDHHSNSITNKDIAGSICLYKENYIQYAKPMDDKTEQGYTQAQLSLQYQPFYRKQKSLYIGYTTVFWWMTNEISSEITETNYNIEGFYRRQKVVNVSDHLKINRIQFGIDHTSNGKRGPESRGINLLYTTIGAYTGDRLRLGGEIKAFAYFDNSIKNEDIQNFTGNFTYNAYLSWNSHTYSEIAKLNYKVQLGGNSSLSNGRQELTLRLAPIPKYFTPFIFVRYEVGFGTQGLVNYNEKHEAVTFGLSIDCLP